MAATRNESPRRWLRRTTRRQSKSDKIKPDTAGDAERRRDDEIRLKTNQVTAGMTAKAKRNRNEAHARKNGGSEQWSKFFEMARERRMSKTHESAKMEVDGRAAHQWEKRLMDMVIGDWETTGFLSGDVLYVNAYGNQEDEVVQWMGMEVDANVEGSCTLYRWTWHEKWRVRANKRTRYMHKWWDKDLDNDSVKGGDIISKNAGDKNTITG
ncbi:hypothetical protein BJ165DRAFT_1410996 [Panaeolus papilionaceus]|nr:hypothetical protein BJ165DRAFT_1410996 [Panaeolus papilionaceus]